MLWKLLTALLLLWLALLVTRHTFGGYAHVLFVAVVAIGLYQILWRRVAI